MMHSESVDIGEPSTREDAGSDWSMDCYIISKEALDGGESPTTMRLHGWVQGREVLMLVDSGSSHSFICESLATHCKAWSRPSIL